MRCSPFKLKYSSDASVGIQENVQYTQHAGGDAIVHIQYHTCEVVAIVTRS